MSLFVSGGREAGTAESLGPRWDRGQPGRTISCRNRTFQSRVRQRRNEPREIHQHDIKKRRAHLVSCQQRDPP